MHDDRVLVEERITRELADRLRPLVHPERRPLRVEAGPSLDALAPSCVGQPWGAPWGTTWFRFRGERPAAWADRPVAAVVDLGFRADSAGFQCEGLVRDRQGRARLGVHPRRSVVPIEDPAGTVELIVEAASNPMFPQFRPSSLGSPTTAGTTPLYRLDRADLVVVDPDAEALVHDVAVLDDVMRTLALDDRRRTRLRHAIVRALDLVASGAGVDAARRTLAPFLTAASGERHRVVACGHGHMDTAWLWPMRETVRKCIRTFTSAVAMMDADPGYRFLASSAQHYAWVEEHEPELFERIRAHVAGGRFVPVGGMWVEADMNLPSGESLVRQLVHGQRYFAERFGVRCREVWIPDVFGYPAGLPQLFAAAGMTRFVTQKLSWNRTNRIPHHTFWWEGVDGSTVLTHFPPVDTYNAEITATELAHAMTRFADHAWSDASLLPYGYGDGGGGPTPDMLERARRLDGVDGMPAIELGTPADFFARVEAEIGAGADVPTWRGELYFETHRGTLTSQLATKAGNRRCERLLREAELWQAHALIAGSEVDAHELDGLWRQVLTQQFHDVLPGSSIAWVHDDAEAVFASVAADIERRIAERRRALTPPGPAVVNAATAARDEVVVTAVRPPDAPVQELADGRVAFRTRVPGLTWAAVDVVAPDDQVVVTERSMANGSLAVAWDSDGHLTSVVDVVSAREIVPDGQRAAVLELAVDQPVLYDAWDLESWTVRQGVAVEGAGSIDFVAAGPLVGMVRVTRRFGPSSAVVTYILRAGSPRLDVHVELDWHHDEHLLSMSFPLDVRADAATCGVQFGAVRRATHPTTSWDAAKFEVCAHRWVDVSEPSFGVAVLDDGRYGHGLFDGRIRVSLARAARYPDPDADRGRHAVTLALLPHGPGLADVVGEAEALNLPLRVHDDGVGTDPAPTTPVTVTGIGMEVDAVKPADDGSGDLVVRLHEACGDRRTVTLRSDGRIASARRTDLEERPGSSLPVSDGTVELTLRPFELATVRLAR